MLEILKLGVLNFAVLLLLFIVVMTGISIGSILNEFLIFIEQKYNTWCAWGVFIGLIFIGCCLVAIVLYI